MGHFFKKTGISASANINKSKSVHKGLTCFVCLVPIVAPSLKLPFPVRSLYIAKLALSFVLTAIGYKKHFINEPFPLANSIT